jgi:DNA-binding beta-propeller fold protein YncE
VTVPNSKPGREISPGEKPTDPLVVSLGDALYEVEAGWGRFVAEARLRELSHLAVDSHDNVYVFQRSDPPVIVLDRTGRFLRSWGSGRIKDAHGIYITAGDDVLLIDRDAHEVMRFDVHGRLDLVLGKRNRPSQRAPFNHPADVAVAPDGDIFVADGYGNSAVHCFSPDGEWKRSWGTPGRGPGQFSTPHGIWVDELNRVLVVDRENDRIQIFAPDGEFLDSWTDAYYPMDIYLDRTGSAYVTDRTPRISKLSADGTLVGRCRSPRNGAHSIWGDSRGDLYLAEQRPDSRVTKFVRREPR